MNKRERKEQAGLPSYPNPDYPQSHVVRNGSQRGRQRYHCRTCKTSFGETEGRAYTADERLQIAQLQRSRL